MKALSLIPFLSDFLICAAREWAYDRQSANGHFNKGLDAAQAKGWTVVSMKGDWRIVYGEDK